MKRILFVVSLVLFISACDHSPAPEHFDSCMADSRNDGNFWACGWQAVDQHFRNLCWTPRQCATRF